MLFDSDLIAYEFAKGQFTPNSVEVSGEKEETKTVDKLNFSDKNPAVLVIEQDIINSEGYGLKKGFYNITTDKYFEFLYIYQTGRLKAKVPVVKYEFIESINPVSQEYKKMSYKKFLKEKEKERIKYIKGENPYSLDYKSAQIHYINEQNSYVIIYNSNNIELTGVIKF